MHHGHDSRWQLIKFILNGFSYIKIATMYKQLVTSISLSRPQEYKFKSVTNDDKHRFFFFSTYISITYISVIFFRVTNIDVNLHKAKYPNQYNAT